MEEIASREIVRKRIRNVTLWGMAVNIFLALAKVAGGLAVTSLALVADGMHSLTDLVTDAAVLISSRAARRPPDRNHPYGHGKFETVSAQLIGLLLFIIGVGFGWSSIKALLGQEKMFPGPLVVLLAFLSLLAKEITFQVTRRVARDTHSASLYANAWHHRSDALSSLAVLFGGVASILGFGYGDQIAGLVVAIMIMAVGARIIFDNLKELSEHAIDEDMVKTVAELLTENRDICHWHKLRTRKIGAEIVIDVHIHVDPELTVRESHALTLDIEEAIANNLSQPVTTLVHVEPCTDEEMRRHFEK